MAANPILVLQMQRMGDMVLTFPLLGWLLANFPGHPLWILGEEKFFRPLMPLSPPAVYFAYGDTSALQSIHFHAVINLSHRMEAAQVAGMVSSDALFGPYVNRNGAQHIRGDWQVYRASLTNNNRFNRFHWADLYGMDIVPAGQLQRTIWPQPRPFGTEGASPAAAASGQTASETPLAGHQAKPFQAKTFRVGLFLGASEAAKHPEATFWVSLARQLLHEGMRPVLLGGEAEKPLGAAVAHALKAPALNLCGHFSVASLCQFVSELDLLITPDTGPMHLATWTGTPVVNLSIGPVNPWETGPFSPGHHVVRANVHCLGCWQCTESSLKCKESITARHVGQIVRALLENPGSPALPDTVRGVQLFRTERAASGLFSMQRLNPDPHQTPAAGQVSVRDRGQIWDSSSLSNFWQHWFGQTLGFFPANNPLSATTAWNDLANGSPQLAERFGEAASTFMALLATALKNPAPLLANPRFWEQAPTLMRPLSGYCQMYAQNHNASKPALLHVLSLAERLAQAIRF